MKPGGPIGIAGVGVLHEIEGPVPAHLRDWWTPEAWCLHSAAWWRRHWEKTGILDIELADSLPDGWRFWLDWIKLIAPENVAEIQAVEADAGRNLGYVRAIGRRRTDAPLYEPVTSVPMEYAKKPLLREG